MTRIVRNPIAVVSLAVVAIFVLAAVQQVVSYERCQQTAKIMEARAWYSTFAGCWLKDRTATHWSRLD